MGYKSDAAPSIAMTAERIDPQFADQMTSLDRAALQLHLERYHWAAQWAADRHVVDLACGTGYGSAILAEAGARSVVGVDVSPEAISFARAHYGQPAITFVTGDALAFAPSAAVDLWVSLETIEHLPDPEAYLRRVHGFLKPDGQLVASVPTTLSTDVNPFHLHDFTQRSFLALLNSVGFVVEDSHVQVQRFDLSAVIGRGAGERQRSLRKSLWKYYLAHPLQACRRVWATLRHGFANEYMLVRCRPRRT